MIPKTGAGSIIYKPNFPVHFRISIFCQLSICAECLLFWTEFARVPAILRHMPYDCLFVQLPKIESLNMTKTVDVLTVGNAIMDIFATCDDAFIADRDIGKGMMNLVDADRSAALYADLANAEEISGGSAANTAVGVAALGGKAAFAGRVHDDQLGHSFCRDIAAANVHFGNTPHQSGAPTASSIILVTPDATRSMNTFLGACIEMQPTDIREEDVAAAQVIYLEGYLFDAPAGPEVFAHAAAVAKQHGTKISVSLSDPWCAERHREALGQFVQDNVDILFANADEATSLCDAAFDDAVATLAGMVSESVITCGPEGAVIGANGAVQHVQAMPQGDVVDTTGAGDLFAAGYLFGRTNGYTPLDSGRIASLAAGEVISHIGARPQLDLAALIATKLG